ncbi:MAG: tryptophan--tRNA ligase [Acidiferrobacterales bacterium]|nr:tryptophan--tRNA ligase [Acidiferrobacterales bacterium]
MSSNSQPSTATGNRRVLSGMRPTGKLHLGHYHGVLRNWIRMQEDYECFFFVADWHALTTHYDDRSVMNNHVWEMVIDWLASGVDPEKSTMFIQSHVPEHAELHLLLSMVTPLGWLERVPSFKDQQEKLREKDLATYGFLGYPLLQSADILMYRAGHVPVGEDQVPHVELTREIARRFNHFFGRSAEFDQQVMASIKQMGKKAAKRFQGLRQGFTEQGDKEALETARQLILEQQNINQSQKDLLLGYLEGRGVTLLPEPAALLTEAAKMPGLDGQKMSKSYGNTIALRDDPARVEQAVKVMPTDPARVRLTDPGDPAKCPVWQLHEVYSDDDTRLWVDKGCRNAEFGCLECKKPLIKKLLEEQEVIHERAKAYVKNPERVREVIAEGDKKARLVASETMQIVRESVGTIYQ